MKRLLCLIATTSVITFTGIAAASADKLEVVASFSIIGDFANRVGGDRIALTTLVGANGDAHVYEPKPADAVAMAGADIVLVNGLAFEGFLSRLATASATSATIVELSKGVTLLNGEDDHHHEEDGHDDHADDHSDEAEDAAADDHHHGDIDPHAFQSVANARIYVKNIADAFCAADGEGCDLYRSNAEAYTAELAGAEAEIKAAVASIPQDKRTIITSHDAFGYFEHAYGLQFLAPEGISTESEASAADVANLIRKVREAKASAIFVENISNPRLVEQIAGETGLTLGGSLYSDALSGPDGPASTYIEMMLHNIRTIRGAILGS
jgi:zinc/manganese transport system substrate-binding protein